MERKSHTRQAQARVQRPERERHTQTCARTNRKTHRRQRRHEHASFDGLPNSVPRIPLRAPGYPYPGGLFRRSLRSILALVTVYSGVL